MFRLKEDLFRAAVDRLTGGESVTFGTDDPRFHDWLTKRSLPDELVRFLTENALSSSVSFDGGGGLWTPEDIMGRNDQEEAMPSAGLLAIGVTTNGDFIVVDFKEGGGVSGFVSHELLRRDWPPEGFRRCYMPSARSIGELLYGMTVKFGLPDDYWSARDKPILFDAGAAEEPRGPCLGRTLDGQGLPPITEYLLPIEDPQFAETHSLSECFAELIGNSVREIMGLLSRRMSSIRSAGVAMVRDAVLSKYRPYALAYDPESDCWFLELVWTERRSINSVLFLKPPLAPRSLDAHLAPYGFAELGAIREFYHHFHGLCFHPCVGGFCSPAEWNSFAELGWYEEEVEEGMDPERAWAKAIYVCNSGGESIMLMRPDGESVWGLIELVGRPGCIVPLRSTFEALMDYLASKLRKGGWPDYYLPH